MTTPSLSLPMARPDAAQGFPLVLASWGVLAAVVTYAGLVTVERRFFVPVVLVVSVTAMVIAYRGSGRFSRWARDLSWSSILAFQALRAPIGMAFLVWAAQGLAPRAFALGAGYGDLTVGVAAIALLSLGSRVGERRGLLLAWNLLGLLDIVAVVVGAQVRFAILEPESLRGLLTTWFPFLPLFVVPLVFAAHFLVFARLRATRGERVAA